MRRGRLIRAIRRLTRLTRRPADDRGSVVLWFAIVTAATMAMAGLVIDGGSALATRERAADVATQAARAGADALDPQSVRQSPTDIVADPQQAQAAAQLVLAAAGATGAITVFGNTVTVTAHISARTAVLSAFGLNDISQSATASATSIFGGQTQLGG
jgi:Flp pilus assembly protein TadG